MYSVNDWRDYIAHAYDWSSGKNPSDYNHDYYEKNKERILAARKKKDGAVRDFGGAGVGYKAKKDGTTGENLEDYENDEDWSDELTPEELKNIELHNAQVDKNIAELTKTVEDYINKNKGSLSSDQVSKLRKDMNTQISIANEQRINTKNSDDYNYMMGLRKKNGGSSSKKSSSSSTRSSSKSSSSVRSSKGKTDPKIYTDGAKRRKTNQTQYKNASDLKRADYEALNKTKKKK